MKTPNITQERLRDVIFKTPPAFHYWKDKPQTGGFSPPFFNFIEGVLRTELDHNQIENRRCLEIGAGLSTLFFLSMDYQVTSFSLPDVIDRIQLFLEADDFAVYESLWSPHAGRSEFLLGKHAVDNPDTYACCLIDGSHSVHSVFTDFTYCHEALGVGGVLFVDDTHFPGPSLLAQLLDQLDSYVDCGRHQKLRAFKKVNKRKSFDNMLGFVFSYPEA
ncbi:class I SAM-dependent methyltransferase [Accumulibacter sp.]|uniref:class I SAM-dependent methyltransferase n=1 Tax=Accumulibacter sp. TaxID=2053492 RepID=UPI002618037D|nr:class I SAM-dependent methyltransferase [Accumulibacter sp.]